MNQIVVPWPDQAFWRRWLLRVVTVGLLLYLAYVVRDIWLPLGLAFLLATILDPVVDRMEYRGWKRTPATCAIFFSTILVVGLAIALAIPHIMDQIGQLQLSLNRYFPDTSQPGLAHSFEHMRIPKTLAGIAAQSVESLQHGFLKSSSWLTDYGMNFVSNLVWIVIVPIVAFYALRDYHLLLGKALLLAPSKHRETVQLYVAEVSAVFSRYLRGLAIVSGLNGLATWALLEVLHVPSAMLLGVVAGILYSVPYIGALLTVVFTAAAAFVGGGIDLLLTAIVASMILHQIVFDQIVTPRILGGQVGIHPIVSIIALLIGNLLLGIIGMVLAVPVAACLQIGVLALVPKLKAEIDLGPDPLNMNQELTHLATETKQEQTAMGATESLHGSVQQAVENVEAQLETEQAESTT